MTPIPRRESAVFVFQPELLVSWPEQRLSGTVPAWADMSRPGQHMRPYFVTEVPDLDPW
jgi:hypothetical protein